MPSGQQVTLEPALALMLAKHFNHAAVRRQVVVSWDSLGIPLTLGHLEHVSEPVRHCLVRPENAEVPRLGIKRYDIAQESA